MDGKNKIEIYRMVLKILMWISIVGFGCNFVMQTISYSFYKSAKQMKDIMLQRYIQFNEKMSGCGYNLDVDSDKIILFLKVPIILPIIQLENLAEHMIVRLFR